ncbi:MAG: VWA domain-containing protein [Acidobacteriaceae bacterium]|nr:VWA domain-containing protein [Acidobacteriaceae bacterium]
MRISVLFCAGACLALASVLSAQQALAPGGTEQTSALDIETIRVEVNLVNVYLSVHDKQGNSIDDLHKEDCSILEDKVPQTIRYFTQEKTMPLTVGLLLDTSGSQKNVLHAEQLAAMIFLKDVLTPKDESFLMAFDLGITQLTDHTNSRIEIARALGRARTNVGGDCTDPKHFCGTLLNDAVYQAAHEKLLHRTGRKVIILLTDGGDYGSQKTLDEAIRAAQRSDAIVYVILLDNWSFMPNANARFSKMTRLAQETGGRVIDVDIDSKINTRLQKAFALIQIELRKQYLASYTPANTKRDGTYRQLSISCGKRNKVQARAGYYAAGLAE